MHGIDTIIDDEYTSDNLRIGVAIVRHTHDGYPPWARKLPSPIPQGTPIEMMRDPWLWPLSGDKSSIVVDWEDGLEEFLFQYPLQAGDRLAIVAKLDDFPTKLQSAARFSVTLQVEYEHEHGEE